MHSILANMLRAPRILFAKRTVVRPSAPFDLDLGRYAEADYTSIVPSLREIERQLRALPKKASGLRFIHGPDTVFFLGEQTLPIGFDALVSRVDIGHVGRFYRDALSAETVVAGRDDKGRARHQGVRVVVLPQPNYAGLMGKGLLDVYKLESIERTKDEHRVWMRTVLSPNGSAVCDDGFAAFARSPNRCGTQVTFLACQNFPVPPLMAWARLDRWRWFKRVVTEDAYRRFFDTMVCNIVDGYRGVDFRVGCDGPARHQTPLNAGAAP